MGEKEPAKNARKQENKRPSLERKREKEMSLIYLTIDHEIFISIYTYLSLTNFEIGTCSLWVVLAGQEWEKKSRKQDIRET